MTLPDSLEICILGICLAAMVAMLAAYLYFIGGD